MEIYQNYHHDDSVIYQLISSTHKKVGEDTKIGRVRREEREREQEKAQVKSRISSGEQRAREKQRRSRKQTEKW